MKRNELKLKKRKKKKKKKKKKEERRAADGEGRGELYRENMPSFVCSFFRSLLSGLYIINLDKVTRITIATTIAKQ